MNFNDHKKILGMHAFLGASKHSWLRYTDEKMQTVYTNAKAAERGTRIHSFAAEAIALGEKLRKSKRTVCLYVNDAIDYKMTPEQVLFYSENCFGTADAISFRNNELRIHDLKTGSNPASMEQLEIYAALFCLEYRKKPKGISIELRIYQNDQVLIDNPEPEKIEFIMDKIKHFDSLIKQWEGAE